LPKSLSLFLLPGRFVNGNLLKAHDELLRSQGRLSLDARFRQLNDFRLLLEEFAVRHLATDLDEAGLKRIRDATAALSRRTNAGDSDGALQADLELHDLLIELTGNQPLRATYRSLMNEMKSYVKLAGGHDGGIDDLASAHVELLGALREKRPDHAARVMRRHLEHGLDGALAAIDTAGPMRWEPLAADPVLAER